MDECKRSGQIPVFGDWDLAHHLPITQYFECARQAGLVRPTSSSAETHRDLYASDFNKMRRKRRSENGNMNIKRQGKVWDVPGKPNGKSEGLPPPRRPKPVDQDLYQIPPQLLRSSKRGKMLGFISKCLLPSNCVS